MARLPLQNRVSPDGALHATWHRGRMMGVRGGRFHDPESQTLGTRRWASRNWICCQLEFKGRRHDVWGKGYTALFFADEPTALAAGHRPCFACRRDAANAFMAALKRAFGPNFAPNAEALDRILDQERRNRHVKRLHERCLADLPDGAFFAESSRFFTVFGNGVFEWSFSGYRPTGLVRDSRRVLMLTPPTIAAALAHGYPVDLSLIAKAA